VQTPDVDDGFAHSGKSVSEASTSPANVEVRHRHRAYAQLVITDPDAVRILCFGDSNTHGASADDPDYARLGSDVRWTGVLQTLLGAGYDVVEEGLNGRTTDVDYDDRPGCNGRQYFLPCLLTHAPLDVIVIMLGTNDLKVCFGRTAETIAGALHGFLDDIAACVTDRHGGAPTTLLVSPILIDDSAPRYEEVTAASYDSAGVARSRDLGAATRAVALERRVLYADASQVARAGDDGLHLTLDSHARVAELVAATVQDARAQRARVVRE
jgi:lysophospholipase L1-like esterase